MASRHQRDVDGQQEELDLWGERGSRRDTGSDAGRDASATAEASDRDRFVEGVFTAPRVLPEYVTNLPEVTVARSSIRGAPPEDWEAANLVQWSNWGYTEPEVVRSIWRMLELLGVERGRVLEPGAGGGAFTAMAPPGVEVTRIETLATNARRAKEFYPEAVVRWETFASSDLPDGHFDAVVGNIPWASVHLDDPRYKRLPAIREHFIMKSLALTRPGGVVAVVTNFRALDDKDPRARRKMNELADLLGAVRMPDGLQQRASGWASSGDILVLRRREPGVEPASRIWENTRAVQIDGQAMRMNEYFLERPDHVLGQLSVQVSSYGTPEWIRVRGDLTQAPGQLADALVDVATAAQRQRGGAVRSTAADRATSVGEEAATADPHDLWDSYRAALVALGDARGAELFKSAAAQREGLRSTDAPSLRDVRHAAEQALDRLDRVAARTAWELECAQRTAQEKRREAQAAAQEQEAAVARTVGREREQASTSLTLWRHELEGHDRDFARAADSLQQLREAGRHPDQWMGGDGQSVASWVARERGLASEKALTPSAVERAAPPRAGPVRAVEVRGPGLGM